MKSVRKIFAFMKRGSKQEELVGEMPPEMARRIPWVRDPSTSGEHGGGSTSDGESGISSTTGEEMDTQIDMDEDGVRTIHPVQQDEWTMFSLEEIEPDLSSPSVHQLLQVGLTNTNVTTAFEPAETSTSNPSKLPERGSVVTEEVSIPDEILESGSETSISKEGDHIPIHGNAAALLHGNRAHLYHQFHFAGTVTDAQTAGIVRPTATIHKYEGFGLFGLYNIGNTCYMNSVVQCLVNTRPFLERLLNQSYKNDINGHGANEMTSSKNGHLIVECLDNLIKSVWQKSPWLAGLSGVSASSASNNAAKSSTSSPNTGDPTMLKTAFETKSPLFKGGNQQDAHEFLHYFLDAIHSELNRATKKSPTTGDQPSGSGSGAADQMSLCPEDGPEANAWDKYLVGDNSIIVDNFAGQLKSTVTCRTCGNESTKYETFWDLSVPLPKAKSIMTSSGQMVTKIPTLEECLHLLLDEHVLGNENLVYCQQCKAPQKSLKKLEIEEFPRILVIHLKRFSPDAKLTTPVKFPLYNLEMKQFSSVQLSAGCAYNLYGLVNHSGTNNSGHYIAYCKHPFNYFQDWFKYDDTEVSLGNDSVISKCTSDAYLLFYEMCTASRDILSD